MEIIIAIILAFLAFGNQPTVTKPPIDTLQLDKLPQNRLPDGGFVIGNPKAPVTIIEFGDYACPHCQEYLPTMNQFIETYVKTGKAKFEFRILPTAGGALTQFIGTVLVCMEKQKSGTYWKAYDILFKDAIAGNYDSNTLRNMAGDLGVNYADALNCAQSEKQVDTDGALAATLNVHGTPAIRVRDAKGKAHSLVLNDQAYDQGGPSFDVLSQYMAQFK